MVATALILDLDGTVWHSWPWYAEIIAWLSGSARVDIEHKLQAGESIVQIAKDYGVSKARLTRAASENAESMELYGSVHQTLDCLQSRGTPLGIVSNLPGWLTMPLLQSKGIYGYFHVIATPRPGLPAKPKPQGILRVIEQMGREIDAHIWFIDDGQTDTLVLLQPEIFG